jgi:diguanylate cyclase
VVGIVTQYFITNASFIIPCTVLILHLAGFLAERYITNDSSPAVWAAVAAVDAAFAYKCSLLVKAAFRDNLTALYNRNYFTAAIAGRRGGEGDGGEAVSLLMIDVDDFKQINDTYGHGVGDAVLRQLAALLKANLRKNDAAVRWGGEEFLVFLAGADQASAGLLAERIRAAVAGHRFGHGQHTLAVTVSIGIASAAAAADIDRLTRLADEALYCAKQTKNAIVF